MGSKNRRRPGRATPEGAACTEGEGPGLVDVSGEQVDRAQHGRNVLHVVTLDGGDRARHLGRFEDAEQVQGGLEGTDAGTEALNALHLDDAHEVREAVLLGAHGLPVAALVGLPT